MTYIEAQSALKRPPVFGDVEQIEATKTIEAYAVVRGKLSAAIDRKAEVKCGECGGDGKCTSCGDGSCHDCHGRGFQMAEDTHTGATFEDENFRTSLDSMESLLADIEEWEKGH